MSAAEDLVKSGDLDGALKELQAQVRKSPSDVKLRIFLFQLLALNGQWGRANTQLDVAKDLDAITLPMVQTYREALRCEALRAEVFAGERTPLVFGEPEQWVALLIEALKPAARGDMARFHELQSEAFDAAPVSSGRIDGEAFEWLADADMRLGPVLEVIVNGRYWWAPFARIERIRIEPPADLRDAVWMPAEFTWTNGGEVVGLIPTRYPGTERCEDVALRQSRKTEWLDRGDEVYFGLGQRMLATDAGDHPLMSVREIVFDLPASGAEAVDSAAELGDEASAEV